MTMMLTTNTTTTSAMDMIQFRLFNFTHNGWVDTELYQHMCNCFTSTLHGGFHAVVFHCIIKLWVYSCSFSTSDQFAL